MRNLVNVFSPDINYYENPDAIRSILDSCSGRNIDVVLGSSIGGFAGYYVANALNLPALLFNPALKERSVRQNINDGNESFNNLKHIVIGQIDDVVAPRDTLDFLFENFNPVTDLYLHVVPQLGHNIVIDFFEKEVTDFFNKVNP